jgi:dolichol kinase
MDNYYISRVMIFSYLMKSKPPRLLASVLFVSLYDTLAALLRGDSGFGQI